ncbi:hypothetical protein BIY45_07365 [Stenotrophomonas sp. BIIR7]|nr:hypothetical protein BIY45_07365 [Stenotrophomonas sp. BIIR7]
MGSYGWDSKVEQRRTGAVTSLFIAPQYTTKSARFAGSFSPWGQARVRTVEWLQRRHALAPSSWVPDSTSINATSRESGGAGTAVATGLAGGSDGFMARGLGGGWLGSSAQARCRFFAAFNECLRVQCLLIHLGQSAFRSGLSLKCFEAFGVGSCSVCRRIAHAVVTLSTGQALATAAGLGDGLAFVFGGRPVQLGCLGEVILLDSVRLLAQQ